MLSSGCSTPEVTSVSSPACHETLTENAFRELMQEALASGTPLDLTGRVVTLSNPVKLRRSESLTVIGGTVVGEGHSIFSMGTDRNKGPPALIIQGTELRHTKMSTDRREIGAAIFIMGKARVVVDDATISSAGGFCVWVKHSGSVVVRRSLFESAGRTSLAGFNHARAILSDTTIRNAAIHGVCLRSDAAVELERCTIADCGDRGAYVYERGSLSMIGCLVTGTCSPTTPAVHARGVQAKDDVTGPNTCRLSIVDCKVIGNGGPGIVIENDVIDGKDTVTHKLRNNTCDSPVEWRESPDVGIADPLPPSFGLSSTKTT